MWAIRLTFVKYSRRPPPLCLPRDTPAINAPFLFHSLSLSTCLGRLHMRRPTEFNEIHQAAQFVAHIQKLFLIIEKSRYLGNTPNLQIKGSSVKKKSFKRVYYLVLLTIKNVNRVEMIISSHLNRHSFYFFPFGSIPI